MGESDWVSAHVFHHDDQDRLLIEVVGPLVEELAAAGLAMDWFFLRYWDGGPHLRFRVLPAAGRRVQITELVVERFGRYLRDHPAPNQMGVEEYVRLARDLARWEGLEEYSERQYPNNSVVFLPYRREHNRYGDGASIEAVERHFVESSRIALEVLPVTTRSQRAVIACAMILLAWFADEPDPKRLSGSVTRTRRDSAGLSDFDAAGFDTDFERQRDRWVDLARRMRTLAEATGHTARSGALIDWARSVVELRDVLAIQIAAGAFTPQRRGWEGAGAIAAPGRPGNSRADHGAVSLPTLDLCAHLICNRLGIGLTAETQVRHLAARAVDTLAHPHAAAVPV